MSPQVVASLELAKLLWAGFVAGAPNSTVVEMLRVLRDRAASLELTVTRTLVGDVTPTRMLFGGVPITANMDVSKVQIGEITTLEVEFPDQVCVLGLRNTSTDPKKVQFQISKDLNVVASAFRCTPR